MINGLAKIYTFGNKLLKWAGEVKQQFFCFFYVCLS